MKRKNTDDASKLEFMKNLIGMRQVSIKNGNSQMSLEEINAEIKAARKKRTLLTEPAKGLRQE